MSIRSSLWMSRPSAAFITLFVAAACAEPPEFVSLDRPLPTAFAATQDALMPRQVDVIWWRNLNDPIVDELVAAVYADNLTLNIAALRVSEAEALRKAAGSPLSATGSIATLGQRDLDAETTETGSTTNLGLTWLFDPFGRLAANQEIAQNSITLARAELASARQVVVATLLNTYVDLRFQQAQRRNTIAEIERRRSTISQQQRGAQAGNVTEIELTNARAQLAARQTALPSIEADIAILKNQIAVLAGTTPGSLTVDLSENRRQPLPAAASMAGLPADLLRNRADLFILERTYYQAVLNVTVARADLYPRLSLGGNLSLNTIGADSQIASFGPRIELPALPNGAARGQLDAAEVRVQIAFDEWSEAVLNAVANTEAALLSLEATEKALRSADQSVALSRQSLELIQQVLAFNGATLDDVTVAEDRVAEAEATRSRLRQAYARAFIDLQVQLGSGEVLALGAPPLAQDNG